MKYKKTILTFFINAVILCGTFSGFAQQLPEIIWSKMAPRAESADFVSTHSIRFSPDGQRVIAGGSRYYNPRAASITIFNAADGAVINATQDFFFIESINELDISPDGQRISTAHNNVTCDNDQTNCRYSYVLYNAQTLNWLSAPPTTLYTPSASVEYSPDGQIVAVGGTFIDGNIRFLNPTDLSTLRTLPGHPVGNNRGRTTRVRFSPNGQLLASGGGDDKVKIWRVSDGALLQTFTMNSAMMEVFSVEFSPDGQSIAATSRDTTSQVKVWRISDGALLKTFTNPYFYSIPSHEVTWTRDGRYVVTTFETGSDGSRIRFWDFNTGELAREYTQLFINPYTPTDIKALEFSADGRTFAFSIGPRVLLARNSFAPINRVADFDGDGRSDLSVYRGGNWYMQQSANGFATRQFGQAGDKIMPADFDGDGKTDLAVFRDGVWYWLNSSDGSFKAVQFGQAGDVPVPADYTGDGRAELAVYRNGFWYSRNLADNQNRAVQFGISSDKPVPADFDADGKTDFAVYRDGFWYMLRSTAGFTGMQFGIASDKPVVGDYDGDLKADQAVYRNGVWYILGSTNGFSAVQFGITSDVPVAADYDGDGKTDVAVFRDGIWYMLRSQQGFGAVQFGITNDQPIPAAFAP